MSDGIVIAQALAVAMRRALADYGKARDADHTHTLLLACRQADLNALLAHADHIPEPVYVTAGVAWWGRHQVVPDNSLNACAARLLVDARSTYP